MTFNIFKRQKPTPIMPEPNFEDNWKQEAFEKNIKEGVNALQNGKPVCILDDGRGYELALAIKQQFIQEYAKQLAEKITINGIKTITISIDK